MQEDETATMQDELRKLSRPQLAITIVSISLAKLLGQLGYKQEHLDDLIKYGLAAVTAAQMQDQIIFTIETIKKAKPDWSSEQIARRTLIEVVRVTEEIMRTDVERFVNICEMLEGEREKGKTK